MDRSYIEILINSDFLIVIPYEPYAPAILMPRLIRCSYCCSLVKALYQDRLSWRMMHNTYSPNLASLSVESLLSVPLRYIFRETQTCDRGGGGSNGTASSGNHAASFIFSKSECATLLRVSMAST
jgi:hypothetical protein